MLHRINCFGQRRRCCFIFLSEEFCSSSSLFEFEIYELQSRGQGKELFKQDSRWSGILEQSSVSSPSREQSLLEHMNLVLFRYFNKVRFNGFIEFSALQVGQFWFHCWIQQLQKALSHLLHSLGSTKSPKQMLQENSSGTFPSDWAHI